MGWDRREGPKGAAPARTPAQLLLRHLARGYEFECAPVNKGEQAGHNQTLLWPRSVLIVWPGCSSLPGEGA